MMRLAIVSDLHIKPSSYDRIDTLIDRVAHASADAVLIAGDVFDRSDRTARALDTASRMLETWSRDGRPVAVIGGNHDAESPLVASLRLPPGVHWFASAQPETLLLPQLRLAVHGVSVEARDDVRDLWEQYPAPVSEHLNIGLMHTSLDGHHSNRICLPVRSERIISDDRYDVWVLGHVHSRSILSERPLVVYPGSPDNEPGFLMLRYEASAPTRWPTTAETPSWRIDTP